MNTLKLRRWCGAEVGEQPNGCGTYPNAMSQGEPDAGCQLLSDGRRDLERQAQVVTEQRIRAEIGYGVLFEGEDVKQDFTVAVDIAFATEIGRNDQWDAIHELQAYIEVAVLTWLAINSPMETRTSLVAVDGG